MLPTIGLATPVLGCRIQVGIDWGYGFIRDLGGYSISHDRRSFSRSSSTRPILPHVVCHSSTYTAIIRQIADAKRTRCATLVTYVSANFYNCGPRRCFAAYEYIESAILWGLGGDLFFNRHLNEHRRTRPSWQDARRLFQARIAIPRFVQVRHRPRPRARKTEAPVRQSTTRTCHL
jgi:hypothetical protein